MSGRGATPEAVDGVLAASRALLGVAVRSLEPVLDELTPVQFRALVILGSRGPQRAGTLAAAVGVHPSTFTRTVDRLAAGGWVERGGHAGNRREVIVELTASGRRAVTSVQRRRRRELERVLARLSEAERARVSEAFVVFARACGEPTIEELAALGG